MKLTARQIKDVAFSIQEKGYSPKEVDEFLDNVLEDYKETEKTPLILDGDAGLPYSVASVHISSDFDGELMPNTVEYDGTVADWIHIENKGIFENVPCINCKDGQYIQKL